MEASISSPTIITYKNIKWIDLVRPNKETMDNLARKFKFHQLDIEDCLTENQRPKIDEYDAYLFIILHFPILSPKTGRITTEEVDIFLGHNFIITIHDDTLPPIEKIREKCAGIAKRRHFFRKGTGYFLYELVSELFDACFPILDKLWGMSVRMERDVFDNEGQQDLLRDIMLLKKNIITFRRILAPERPVVSSLEHKNKKFLPADLEVYFDDVVDKIEKLWNSLDSLKEVSETLQDANESLIGHRTENTIKVLTIFSVVMLPLTLVSGVFGMNVKLPFMNHPDAFLFIGGIMVFVSIFMLAFFYWKKWM
jgi:magnesium transporter